MKKAKFILSLTCILALCSCGEPSNSLIDSATSPSSNQSDVTSNITSSNNDSNSSSSQSSSSQSSSSQSTKSEYEKWRESDNAIDYNKDHKIDETDFNLYNEYITWKLSDSNFDYNGDSKITFEDYKLHTEYLNWINSDEAIDLNDDRKINQNDYLIYLSSDNIYSKWIHSENAKDYNRDGKIDIKDFNQFNLFGEYEIANYYYRGVLEIGFLEDGFYFRNLGVYLNQIKFKLNEQGLKIILGTDLATRLNNHYDEVVNTVNSAKLDVSSKDNFNIKFMATLEEAPYVLALYFTRNDINNSYSTSVTLTKDGYRCDINFDLIKNETTQNN